MRKLPFALVIPLAILFVFVGVVYAATLIQSGFETGDLSEWEGSFVESGNAVIAVSSIAYDGSYSLQVDLGTSNDDAKVYQSVASAPILNLYARAWMIDSATRTSGAAAVFVAGTSDVILATVDLGIAIRNTGSGNHVWLYAPDTGQVDTGDAIPIDDWFCLQFEYHIAASGSIDIWLNESNIYSEIHDLSSEGDQSVVWIGTDGPSGTEDQFYYDLVEFSDSEMPSCTPTIPPSSPIVKSEVIDEDFMEISVEPQLLIVILDIIFMLIAIKRGGVFFWLVPLILSSILIVTSETVLRYFAIILALAQAVGAYDDIKSERI